METAVRIVIDDLPGSEPAAADSPGIAWVPVRSLQRGDSPRQSGEDLEHIRMLARIDEPLPPIIVHRPSMRVIDGAHRLGAALLRGDEMIAVRFFDGTEQEAFVLAVRTNVTHGLPLSAADRTAAAERILSSHPDWSDRAIATVTGLGARSVANARRRLEIGSGEEIRARTGRDGRVRPLDNAEGRRRALALISNRPEASLRQIAREAGVSPSTVRDVRRRVERGEDPVPQVGRRRAAEARPDHQVPDGAGLSWMLQGLQADPSLRFSESGRTLLRWIFSRAIHPNERVDVVGKIPPHCTYVIATVARACADEWIQLADALDRRGVESA
uniref:ParB-like N-terminal domain-containing protein n=1 Tax=uncultured organism CA37 TaxID=941420 RepID=E9L1J6_9ZZZZ|nr:hypothetical protein CA37-52 [uncultured organism CA37]